MPPTNLPIPPQLQSLRIVKNWDSFFIVRVIAEHKERYMVRVEDEEVESEITGHLRFAADSREDFTAMGDWEMVQVARIRTRMTQI